MDNKKILYISQEIAPYLPATPMANLCKDLPQGIQEKGFEVRTFMPKYGCINERRNQLHEVIRLSGMNIIIDDTDHPLLIKVATLQPSRIQIYFIDNEDYFQHHAVTDMEIRQIPNDNDERIIFFVRGVVETVKKLRWEPAIVHCSGWISALAPLYLKRIYQDDPSFRSSKIVYSIFNDSFNGTLNERFYEKLKLEKFADKDIKLFKKQLVDYKLLNKIAIDYADGIILSSPKINGELKEYAMASGKPILDYCGESGYLDSYADFYNSL